MTGRRVLAGVGAIVGVAVAVAAVGVHVDDRRELAALRTTAVEAQGELRSARSEHDAIRATLAERTAELRRTTAELVDATTRRDEAAAELEATAAQRVEAQARLAGVRRDLTGAQDALGTITGVVDRQGDHITSLATCLGGISRTTAALAAGDGSRAVAEMAMVAGPCDAAEKALAGPAGRAPVMPFDFGDPFVLSARGAYYAYGTNAAGGHVQLGRSNDLHTWEWLGDALPELPSWAAKGRTWAPSVLQRGDRFVLYYAVRHHRSDKQCISTATAADPSGPFTDTSKRPFICQLDQGGSIDPSPLVDAEGRPWLVWKGEGETVGASAILWSQRLSDDGRSLQGSPTALLRADRSWERNTIEGPSMVAGPSGYHLFYSAASWNSADYAVGHARCASPAGPCTKQGNGPVLASSGSIAGPGGQEVFVDHSGALRLSFHAWTDDLVGFPNKRNLHLAGLTFDGGRPVISL